MVNNGSGGGTGGGGGGGSHNPPQSGGPQSGGLQILNPPFDQRMRSIGSPEFTPGLIKRGWIQTAAGTNGKSQGPNGNCRVNFLFNPSTVSASSTVNITQPSPQQVQTNDNRVPGDLPFYASTGSTLGFSLLFDRTYDLWTNKNTKPTVASTFGVYSDVGAFYYYFGMITEPPSAAQVGPGHIGQPGDPAPPVITQGWRTMSPMAPPHYFGSHIYIGDKLFFYGACESLAITYTHWNHEMVPMRCSIDLSFTLLQDPATTQKAVNALGLNAGGLVKNILNKGNPFG